LVHTTEVRSHLRNDGCPKRGRGAVDQGAGNDEDRMVGVQSEGGCPTEAKSKVERGLLTEDFVHRLAFGEFVDELVEVADVAHEGVVDVFDADAADDAFNQ